MIYSIKNISNGGSSGGGDDISVAGTATVNDVQSGATFYGVNGNQLMTGTGSLFSKSNYINMMKYIGFKTTDFANPVLVDADIANTVFDIRNNEYHVQKYNGSASYLKIPATYNGLNVVGIDSDAFDDSYNLLMLYYPYTMTINSSLFDGKIYSVIPYYVLEPIFPLQLNESHYVKSVASSDNQGKFQHKFVINGNTKMETNNVIRITGSWRNKTIPSDGGITKYSFGFYSYVFEDINIFILLGVNIDGKSDETKTLILIGDCYETYSNSCNLTFYKETV